MSAGTTVEHPVRRLLRQVGSFWPAFVAGALLGCLAGKTNLEEVVRSTLPDKTMEAAAKKKISPEALEVLS